MLFFVMTCGVFVLVSLLVYYFQDKTARRRNFKTEKVWNFLTVFCLLLWLILFYMNEIKGDHSLNENVLIRSYFPIFLWLIITIIGVGLYLWILNNEKLNKGAGKYNGIIRAVSSVVFTFVTAIQFYAPNIFGIYKAERFIVMPTPTALLMCVG